MKKRRKTRKKTMEKTIFSIIVLVASLFGINTLRNDKNIKATKKITVKNKKTSNTAVTTSVKKGSKDEYTVIKVSDGDTFTAVKIGSGEEIKVRMYAIDAPESKQEYGTQSKEYLSSLIMNKDVVIEVKQKDRYGRVVANVFYKNENINEKMVKTGNAWWYEEYSEKNSPLEEYQENAKKKKLGLFGKKGYVEPWEWRKMRRKQNQNSVN